MLGFLLVLLQIILFLCIIGLLLLMRKNIRQRKTTADGEYVSSYREEEPDYRDYEYDDNDDGAYEDYYEEPSRETKSAANRIKSQQYEYADEESEHYYSETEHARHFAEQEEPAYRHSEKETAPQRFSTGKAAQHTPQMYSKQYFDQAEKRQQSLPPLQAQHAGPRPTQFQHEPEHSHYYNEDAKANAAKPQRREGTSSRPKPLPPEPKGVLFDDNDDDTAPFKVKF